MSLNLEDKDQSAFIPSVELNVLREEGRKGRGEMGN